MDSLILGVLLACAAPPEPTSPPPAPAVEEAEPQEAHHVEPAFSNDIVLQIFRPSDGYTLRVWADARITEAWAGRPEAERRPYDPTLQYDAIKQRFVEAQRESWAAALSKSVAPGPYGPDGKVPNRGEVTRGVLVFRSWQGGQEVSAEIEADLKVPATLGPLEAPYLDLRKWVFAPNK